MTRASLERAVPADDRLLLGSSCLISHLDGSAAASRLAAHVIDALMRSGRNPATVDMVSAMGILARPRRRTLEEYEHVLDFLKAPSESEGLLAITAATHGAGTVGRGAPEVSSADRADVPCPQRPSLQAHVAGGGEAVTKTSLAPLAPVADILRA